MHLGVRCPPAPSVPSPAGAALQGDLPALAPLEGFVWSFHVVARVVEGFVQTFVLPILFLMLVKFHISLLVP